MKSILFYIIFCYFGLNACNFTKSQTIKSQMSIEDTINYDTATFAAGCFWCVEAIFSELKGVKEAYSGYTGGTIPNPSYEDVCTGKTGHAEAVQIIFNPKVIEFSELLNIFWQTHDPTTLNRQGADIGSQYRSAIFYHNENQRTEAELFKEKLNVNKIFDMPVITQIVEATMFYKAENYHQNYFLNNSSKPYCTVVIKPKLDKFKKLFKNKIK